MSLPICEETTVRTKKNCGGGECTIVDDFGMELPNNEKWMRSQY